MRPFYSLLFFALLPFITLRLLWKGRALPGYRERVGERFGHYKAQGPSSSPIWIHAVSVGECEAAFPLVRRIRQDHPDIPVLMTCTTATGSSRIRAVFGDAILHAYLPYDVPVFVSRFYSHFRPRLGIVMETEIWPNLFIEAKVRDIPLMIANGRLSERSVRGYRRLRSLVEPALTSVQAIAAQSIADAGRYEEIGADASRIKVTGNIKFDIRWDLNMAMESEQLRLRQFKDAKVMVAGSTHPGEEEMVLQAFGQIRTADPSVVLVLVPRHPERAEACVAVCEAAGFIPERWSDVESSQRSGDILVVDRVGVLRTFYGLANVAYIGGSLVPHGGQNPLEPLIAGVPVLFGPHMNNFREIRQKILDANAGIEVNSTEALAEHVIALLNDPAVSEAIGRRGEAMIVDNQGALDRLYAIAEHLTQSPNP